MKPDSRCLLLPLLLQASLTLANDELSAGSRHRCVPNADRTGWECSGSGNDNRTEATAAAPELEPAVAAAPSEPESTPLPEPYLEPATSTAEEPAPAPPPLVAAPPEDATPLSDFYRAVPEPEPTASPAPETVMSEPQAVSSAPESAPEPEPAAEPVPTPVEPEPAPSEPVAIESEPVAPVASEPVPEPVPPAPVPEPEPEPVSAPEPVASSAVAAWQLSDLATARDFASLNGNAYTLQLADAASPQAFPRLIAELGLAPASCYVLKVKRDGQDWWLLAHGEFADANTAKSLLARLPNVPGLTRNWPRKIQYLQREFDTVGP